MKVYIVTETLNWGEEHIIRGVFKMKEDAINFCNQIDVHENSIEEHEVMESWETKTKNIHK